MRRRVKATPKCKHSIIEAERTLTMDNSHPQFQFHFRRAGQFFFSALIALLILTGARTAFAATVEFNSNGGNSPTNGLHFYIDNTSKIQVRRANNTGQVYSSTATPPSNSLDNGVFIRADGRVYGPSHTVGGGYTPNGGMYSSSSISAASPANPSSSGVQQVATSSFAIPPALGLTVSVVWKYTTPLDFMTAEVTVTIPVTTPVTAFNPVRYFHVFDTFLGGSDQGCGIKFTDSNGKLVVGTYKPTTAGTCPSSSVLPAGVTIVESFRERSGMPFSSYCAAGWQSFYVTGGVNCAVPQFAPFSNTIASTYQDTGIGVTFDFTAPGTYTFSYDFVIGTTVVPAYDHLEIQHDGSATLCPENVKVLACTSTTVPCPVASVVNTGTLTGDLTVTPAAPAVSVTPGTFSIGPTVYAPTVVLQGSGAGTFTLGVSGISGTVPLNGTKCWNGTSASCTLTVANTPCVANFECMETGVSYNNLTPPSTDRNPLYTKLVGTDFDFDVVAVQTDGAIASTYAGTVSVELFDDTSPPGTCAAYSLPVTSAQDLVFAATDGGRKKIATKINLPRAYSKLRCRATQTTPATVSGCSSDDFTVRPNAITSITSTGGTADVAGLSASDPDTPKIKTGAVFNLTANTNTAGYNDKPKVDPNLLEWLSAPVGGRAAPGTGNLIGDFTTAASAVSGNGASGEAFTYDEVGYFRFKPQGVYDNSFTTHSDDLSKGDCTDDASNALVGGKYGCKFGNTVETNYFGRFIPDHFVISAATLTNACVSATPFSYFSQDGFTTVFTVTAQNASNVTTQNYSGAFAKMNPTAYASYGFSAAPLPAGSSLTNSAVTPIVGSWSNGVARSSHSVPLKGVIVTHQISRPTALTAQTSITLSAAPSDGEVPAIAATAIGGSPTTTPAIMRYGRLRMQNAFGTEALALPVSVIAQYWGGSGWVQNVNDSCTLIVAPTPVAGLNFVAEVAANVKGNHLSAGETTATVNGAATGSLVAGDARLVFSRPGLGNNGYVDITFTAPLWLQFPWKGAGNTSPIARATFGIYKNANEFIYMREIH